MILGKLISVPQIKTYLFSFSYESIIATLCESLDTLDEPEAKVFCGTYFLAPLVSVFFKRQQIVMYILFTGINDLDNW